MKNLEQLEQLSHAAKPQVDVPQSSLVSKNITIFDRRTSVRLEPQMWNALNDIAAREECSVHEICSLIDISKRDETSLTAAIRVFLMLYYRAATTEQGHHRAGHGDFMAMKKRAKMSLEHELLFQKAHHKKDAGKRYRGNNDN